MSNDANRHKVFYTTRVRTTLKNDGCWIKNAQEETEEQCKARSDHAVELRPAPVRPNSYVLSTTKKFELQAPKEELTQKCVEQPEISVANKSAENKEEYAAAVYQSNVQHNDGVAVVYAEVHFAEQPAANTTVENKGEHADATVGRSNIEHNEAKVSADVHVEDPVAESFAAAGTEESKDTAEVPAVLAFKLKSQEDPSSKTEPENAVVETAVQPAGGSYEKSSSEQAADDSVEAVAEVVAQSSSEKSEVANATPRKEAALPDGVKAVAEVVVKSSPKTSDVVNATPGKEAALPDGVKAVAEVVVKSSPKTSDVVNATPGKEAALPDGVKAVAEVVVKSSPEKSDVVNATSGEEAILKGNVEPVPDLVAGTVPESPTQPAAETAVKSLESKVVSAAEAEEVVEFEVAPVVNTVVEQSVKPTPERPADDVVELNIENAVEPVTAVQDKFSHTPVELSEALDAEPLTTETSPKPLKDSKQSHTEETKPNQRSEHTNTSEIFKRSKEKEQPPQKQNVTRKTNICSFCDKRIDGNVKLLLSEPEVICHPDCLKCGVCAKVLGDLLTTMFLHGQEVQCGACFAKTLKSEA
ncbi:zinc finger protein 185 isoform X1 [Etheostoma cragini]|uniref:zinc finger protein 185 isoform X1 n=1 Tax=Etheostoma cragini TaxID=417921 RepID=UPI00155EBE60|nr:zinc finger protein 185 isoform X1 [Etheostoma cragini]